MLASGDIKVNKLCNCLAMGHMVRSSCGNQGESHRPGTLDLEKDVAQQAQAGAGWGSPGDQAGGWP